MDDATLADWTSTLNQSLLGTDLEARHTSYQQKMLYDCQPRRVLHEVFSFEIWEQGGCAPLIRLQRTDLLSSNRTRTTPNWPLSAFQSDVAAFASVSPALRGVMILETEQARLDEDSREAHSALGEAINRIRAEHIWGMLHQFVWDVESIGDRVGLRALSYQMAGVEGLGEAQAQYNEANDSLQSFLGLSYHDSFQVNDDLYVRADDGAIQLSFSNRAAFDRHKGGMTIRYESLRRRLQTLELRASNAIRARDDAQAILDAVREA